MLAQVWTLSHTDLSTRADCCADSAWLIAQANAATDMLNHERTHSSRYRSSHSQTPHPVGQAISRLKTSGTAPCEPLQEARATGLGMAHAAASRHLGDFATAHAAAIATGIVPEHAGAPGASPVHGQQPARLALVSGALGLMTSLGVTTVNFWTTFGARQIPPLHLNPSIRIKNRQNAPPPNIRSRLERVIPA